MKLKPGDIIIYVKDIPMDFVGTIGLILGTLSDRPKAYKILWFNPSGNRKRYTGIGDSYFSGETSESIKKRAPLTELEMAMFNVSTDDLTQLLDQQS
jgi:Tfp pilus assembly protein PilZ